MDDIVKGELEAVQSEEEDQNNNDNNNNNNNRTVEEGDVDLRRGPWTGEEDYTLSSYIALHGDGRWNSLARCAGLKRTGKSCRLRWLNYLRPDVRRGNITLEEQLLILELHSRWGNRWSKIAQQLPGRTDNEIKNYWRTRVQKQAKQLKCDVNSKQFKDAMRYLWMPRLLERIQASTSPAPASTAPGCIAAAAAASSTTDAYHYFDTQTQISNNDVAATGQLLIPPVNATYTPENSSAAASSDSFGTPVSDLTECYNYPVDNNQLNGYSETLTSPSAYFSHGLDYYYSQPPPLDHTNQFWIDGGDLSDNFWNNNEDIWFFQRQQLDSNNVGHQ